MSFLSGVLSVFFLADSTPLRMDTGVFESFGRFTIVLLDQSVTITLYTCVLFINNPIRGNIHTLHCHVLCCIYICIHTYIFIYVYIYRTNYYSGQIMKKH